VPRAPYAVSPIQQAAARSRWLLRLSRKPGADVRGRDGAGSATVSMFANIDSRDVAEMTPPRRVSGDDRQARRQAETKACAGYISG